MSSPAHSAVSRIPNQILQKIFSLTTRRASYQLCPNSNLVQFALVNKRWARVAQRELLTHVYLGFEFGNRELWEGIKDFKDMLHSNADLASLVRAIHYGSWSMEDEENPLLAEAILLCPNLVEIEFRGWSYETEPLVNALAACAGLQTLSLSAAGLESTEECDPFCTADRFFSVLQGWHDIRRIVLSSLSCQEEEIALPPAQRNASSSLTSFELPGFLRDKHLLALSEMAPSIAELSFANEGARLMSPSTIVTALERWSQTLTSLKIEHGPYGDGWSAPTGPSPDDYSVRLDPTLSSMPHLRSLSVVSAYLSPGSLSDGFANLASLTYEVWEEELSILVSVLRTPSTLPRLQTLYVRSRGKSKVKDTAVLEDLQDACYQRYIELTSPGL